MHATIVLHIHNHVGRTASLLSRVRKTARIQNRHLIADLQIRAVRMTVHCDVTASLDRLLLKCLNTERNVVVVTVGQENPVRSKLKLDLPFK